MMLIARKTIQIQGVDIFSIQKLSLPI